MGRKDDDEDLNETPSDKTQSINELAKQCKPLNVQLNRIDVSTNGVVYIKDKDFKPSSNDESLKSESKSTKEDTIEKYDNDDNNDATEAETIKKIKEFIAMGRCEEEPKKDIGSTSQAYSVKSVKRKLSQTEESSKVPKKNPSLENLNLELDLTLDVIGEDESETVDDKDQEVNKVTTSSVKIKEKKDKENRKQEIATPSRVSKRIQSKPVKFSVKKMLRGDDVNVLKRIIPGYEKDEGRKISVRQDLLKSNIKDDQNSIDNSDNASLSSSEPSQLQESVLAQTSINEESLNESEIDDKTSEESNSQDRLKSIIENKDNILALSNSIEKLAVGNGKITVELKGNQQKKVVRIAVPPQQSKPPSNASLGPDIIIKRVKPLKKTFTLSDKSKILNESSLSTPNKSSPEDEATSSSSSKVVHITPRIIVERISTPKTKGEILLLHKKNLMHRFKQDARQAKTVRKSVRRRRRKRRTILKDSLEDSDDFLDENDSDTDSTKKQEEEKENIEKRDVGQSEGTKPSTLPEPAETVPPPPSEEKVSNPVKEEKKKEGRPRGRPPKAVSLALQAARAKEAASLLNKNKTPEGFVEKSLQTDNESIFVEKKKKSFDNLFDNYFQTYERLVEHNDSLDSDSSDEFDDFYTHFAKLNKNKACLEKEMDMEVKSEDEITVYDLMNDISLELPGWNIHIPSDGNGFCFAQIDIVDNVPHMKKVIEMDLEFNAKVYVNGVLQTNYCGIYNTYEDIQQLIYDVDIL